MDSPTKFTKKTIQTITRQLMNPTLKNAQQIHSAQTTNEEHIPTESQTPKKHKSIAKKQQKKLKQGMFFYFFINFNVNFV